MSGFCGKFFGRFKDEHADSSDSSQSSADETNANDAGGGKFKKSGTQLLKKFGVEKSEGATKSSSDGGGSKLAAGGGFFNSLKGKNSKKTSAGRGASTLQLAPYLVPIRIQLERDGNKVQI